MSKFSIIIDTSNGAFQENEDYELARMLEKICTEMKEFGIVPQNIRDYNGNIVGTLRYEYEPKEDD